MSADFPSIFENKTNVTCAFETDNITISASVTGTGIDSVWISVLINGVQKNYTAIKMGNRYQVTIPSTDLVGGTNIMWNVYAKGPLNIYNNSWKTFYVGNRTILIVNPSSPDGLAGWYVTEPLFILTKDSSGGNNGLGGSFSGINYQNNQSGNFSTINLGNNQQTGPENNEENQNFFSGITGAVVGALD